MKYRPCNKCGGLDELLYIINQIEIYYCDDCETETRGSTHELVGLEENLTELYGE
tara:strand:+ start:928 stop:1092 length:165 start_codon:yes stop_codon:yes gene_type:complete